LAKDNTDVIKSNTLKEINETSNGSFDIYQYSLNLDEQKEYIKQKVIDTEYKLKTILNKQETMNEMITRTALSIKHNSDNKNFKLRSQYESIYQQQIESLSFIIEMTMKYEDLIFKYQKMLIDIENHKVSSYSKIRAAEKSIKAKEEGNTLNEVDKFSKQLQDFFNSKEDEASPIVDAAKNRLNIKGY